LLGPEVARIGAGVKGKQAELPGIRGRGKPQSRTLSPCAERVGGISRWGCGFDPESTAAIGELLGIAV